LIINIWFQKLAVSAESA